MKLKVIYNKNSQIDPVLDDKIMKAMKTIGFVFYASGCNRINGERDVVFNEEKKGLSNADPSYLRQ